MLFGRPSNAFGDYALSPSITTSLPTSLLRRANEIRHLVEIAQPAAVSRLEHAQIAQRRGQDNRNAAHMVIAPLQVNDIVFIRALAPRKKLSGPRFLGPFRVQRVASKGNYILVNPSGAELARSYPLDQLRLISSSVAADIWSQACSNEDGSIVYPIRQILDHRVTTQGTREYLVRWTGFSQEFDSWEAASRITSPDLISQYFGLTPR